MLLHLIVGMGLVVRLHAIHKAHATVVTYQCEEFTRSLQEFGEHGIEFFTIPFLCRFVQGNKRINSVLIFCTQTARCFSTRHLTLRKRFRDAGIMRLKLLCVNPTYPPASFRLSSASETSPFRMVTLAFTMRQTPVSMSDPFSL